MLSSLRLKGEKGVIQVKYSTEHLPFWISILLIPFIINVIFLGIVEI